MTKAFDSKKMLSITKVLDSWTLDRLEAVKAKLLDEMKRHVPPAYQDQIIWRVERFKQGRQVTCEYPGQRFFQGV